MRKILVIFIICFVTKAWGNKISDAYSALSIFDYFKAKQLFYKSHPKFPAESAFGLATIYIRTDNPFTNVDSAAKYISICKTHFKDTVTYALYHINPATINQLTQKISFRGFEICNKINTIEGYNDFLTRFYFSEETLLSQIYDRRDELQLKKITNSQSSDSARLFLYNYPESVFYKQAQYMFYDFQYNEQTPQKTVSQLQLFLKHFPENPNVAEAEQALFRLVQETHSADSIYRFIKHYSTSITNEIAWKLLYSLSVSHYSKEELTGFLAKYPDYPYNESILKEISLAQNILLPLKDNNDKYGYIDTIGNWAILPQFDDAQPFSEGFAAVCKNDSCYYINKEGNKISEYYFEETENYKDGIAIVKKSNNYYLINRSAQIVSQGYQDINESSGKLYVCKLNNLYGAINAKGEIIIPFSYKKLGNFKNRYAYYMSTLYGLVDINNRTLQAQWDWVSDVDTNLIAIVKKANQFGLMTVNEQLLLPTEYDYITHCRDEIYLVVKRGMYGFFNAKEKCFITSVEYDYDTAFEPAYYTNGKYFKLVKDEDVALVDANGRYSINFNTYSNLFFAKCDIIRIQKNNKYGYVDRKLKAITPVEFEEAEDFKNEVAIVSKKGTAQLINTSGKAIYALKGGAIDDDFSGMIYKVSLNGSIGLINTQGETLLNIEYSAIEQINPHLFYCKKAEGIYLYNTTTKALKKL